MLGTALVVDIQTVWRLVNDVDIRAQFVEHIRRDPIGCSVGGVQNNFHAFQRQIAGKCVFCKNDVPSVDAFQAEGPADIVAFGKEFRKLVV